MKSYFAKYLPVEGEIKEGNWCISKFGILFQLIKGKAQDGDKLAKLFLCTKDIIRNDSVYCSLQDYINHSSLLVQEHAIPALIEQGAFKVIGEISLGANWVTENMEFEELDWSLFGQKNEINGLGGILKNPEYQAGYKKFYNSFVCKVKCSQCHQYH